MKLTARDIIHGLICKKASLINIERILSLPFGILIKTHEEEGPADPALETLLNMIKMAPELLDVAENDFKPGKRGGEDESAKLVQNALWK